MAKPFPPPPALSGRATKKNTVIFFAASLKQYCTFLMADLSQFPNALGSVSKFPNPFLYFIFTALVTATRSLLSDIFWVNMKLTKFNLGSFLLDPNEKLLGQKNLKDHLVPLPPERVGLWTGF